MRRRGLHLLAAAVGQLGVLVALPDPRCVVDRLGVAHDDDATRPDGRHGCRGGHASSASSASSAPRRAGAATVARSISGQSFQSRSSA